MKQLELEKEIWEASNRPTEESTFEDLRIMAAQIRENKKNASKKQDISGIKKNTQLIKLIESELGSTVHDVEMNSVTSKANALGLEDVKKSIDGMKYSFDSNFSMIQKQIDNHEDLYKKMKSDVDFLSKMQKRMIIVFGLIYLILIIISLI